MKSPDSSQYPRNALFLDNGLRISQGAFSESYCTNLLVYAYHA